MAWGTMCNVMCLESLARACLKYVSITPAAAKGGWRGEPRGKQLWGGGGKTPSCLVRLLKSCKSSPPSPPATPSLVREITLTAVNTEQKHFQECSRIFSCMLISSRRNKISCREWVKLLIVVFKEANQTHTKNYRRLTYFTS